MIINKRILKIMFLDNFGLKSIILTSNCIRAIFLSKHTFYNDLTISIIESANRNKSFAVSSAKHRARGLHFSLCIFYPMVLESNVKVSGRDSSSRERFSGRNVFSHVANIKLIWRCLNIARGKFVRGFANLAKFKYYVLITHKVLRPSSPAYFRARVKFVAVPASKSVSANAVKDVAM